MSVMMRWCLALSALLIIAAATGCDKLKDIPANFSGQVLDTAGVQQGYVSVALIDTETGQETYRETTEDTGNFFFEKIEPGKYTVKVLRGGSDEMPNDLGEVSISPGKTVEKTITVQQPEKKKKG